MGKTKENDTKVKNETKQTNTGNSHRQQRNLVGLKIGHLTVLEMVGKLDGIRYYSKVRCDCGNIYNIQDSKLVTGIVNRCCKCNKPNLTHGMRGERIYYIWSSMRGRCNNPNNSDYKDYGGRGIKVCESWDKDFNAFYEWAMANGYQSDLSIDRIDVNGNYEPNNCRWCTLTEQARNKRNTVYVVYNGIKTPISEIASKTGINLETLRARRKSGWSDYDICNIMPNSEESKKRSKGHEKRCPVTLVNLDTNEEMNFVSRSEAGRFLGVNDSYISNRIKKNKGKELVYKNYEIKT